MAHGNSAINSSPEGLPEGRTAGGDQAQLKTYNILQDYAAENMGDLSPGPKGSAPGSPSARTFGADRGDGPPHVPVVTLALADLPAALDTTKPNISDIIPPRVTDDKLKRSVLGSQIKTYDYRDTIPSTSRTWNPETRELRETFPQESAIENPLKEYGGTVLDKNISQTLVRRDEAMISDKDKPNEPPKPGRVIGLTNMKGIHGYGSNTDKHNGWKGETPIHSVTMEQVQTGTDAQGKPIYESSATAETDKLDDWGRKVKDKDGQIVHEFRKQPMLNDDFNRQWEYFAPENLARYASRTNPNQATRVVEAGQRNPRPAVD